MANASPFLSSSATDALNKAIQNIFQKMASPELQLKKYMNFRTTTDYYEKDSSYSGLSEADFTAENASFVEDVPIQCFDKSYTQEMVSVLVPISYMAIKFGLKKRNLMNITKMINDALNAKKEKLAAERLINGFTTAYTHYGTAGSRSIATVGGDSLEAFYTAHTREDGGTAINNVVYDGTTYSLPFDYAGYKAAIRTAALWVDPRGNPRPGNLDTLVCKKGSSVAFKAREILGAIKKGKLPESMDNDGAGTPPFKILELDYLTSDVYWFFFDSSRALTDNEGFQFIESQGNTIDPANIVYKTKETQFSGFSIFQLGHNDVSRCWVGSAGDSQTT